MGGEEKAQIPGQRNGKQNLPQEQDSKVAILRRILRRRARENGRREDAPRQGEDQYDNEEVVRVLLAAGADPNKASNNGTTPLQQAEQRSHNDCVLLLRSALFEPWSPDNHALFPPAFRAAVRTVLCVHNRRPELVGDVEVWLHVLSFAGREWFGLAAPATSDG